MYVIGLTGGIASGKTTAANVLRELGAEVIDVDAIAREMTSPGGAAADAVLRRFGTLDRKALARTVFANERERLALNAIVHPLVRDAVREALAASSAPVCVVDAPLLLEAGMEVLVDAVWVVHVPRAEQIHRVMVRDGLTEAEAIARIDSQMPTDEKLRRADASVNTSGPPEATRARLAALYARAIAKAGEGG